MTEGNDEEKKKKKYSETLFLSRIKTVTITLNKIQCIHTCDRIKLRRKK